MASLGGRNIGDIFDLIHSGLAGASITAVVWMLTKRNIYAKARMGRLTLFVMVLLAFRNIITIRVESTDRGTCAAVAFIRGLVGNLLGPMITNYFLYELFINLVLKPKITNKITQKRVRWAMHLSYQLGAIGFIGFGLFSIPTGISPLRFCVSGYPPNNVTIFGSAWALLATSFQACLYVALLASSKKLSTTQFTPLFKVTALSGLFLAVWQLYVQIDIMTMPQGADWKPFLNTVTFTWRVVNTVLINNYLIGLRERSKSVAQASHGASQSQSVAGGGSTTQSGKAGATSPNASHAAVPLKTRSVSGTS